MVWYWSCYLISFLKLASTFSFGDKERCLNFEGTVFLISVTFLALTEDKLAFLDYYDMAGKEGELFP